MKKLTFATAAFAAALTAFAPNAFAEPNLNTPKTLISYLKKTSSASERDGGKVEKHDKKSKKDVARSKTSKKHKAASRSAYDRIIARHASKNGVPVALARAVVFIESNYRVNARGRAGEIGLMQIKPSTARSMGYSGSVKALYDPETNIRYGMKYLAKAHQLGGGDTCATILRYNAGHGAKRMNRVSAAYCAKVKRYLGS